jgi:hypothetical protein
MNNLMQGKKERQVAKKKDKMCMGNLFQRQYCEMFLKKKMFGVLGKDS